MEILVTSGVGFIGSAIIRHIIEKTSNSVVNVDKTRNSFSIEACDWRAALDNLTLYKEYTREH